MISVERMKLSLNPPSCVLIDEKRKVLRRLLALNPAFVSLSLRSIYPFTKRLPRFYDWLRVYPCRCLLFHFRFVFARVLRAHIERHACCVVGLARGKKTRARQHKVVTVRVNKISFDRCKNRREPREVLFLLLLFCCFSYESVLPRTFFAPCIRRSLKLIRGERERGRIERVSYDACEARERRRDLP